MVINTKIDGIFRDGIDVLRKALKNVDGNLRTDYDLTIFIKSLNDQGYLIKSEEEINALLNMRKCRFTVKKKDFTGYFISKAEVPTIISRDSVVQETKAWVMTTEGETFLCRLDHVKFEI